MTKISIDSLKPGTKVTLGFNDGEEPARFLRIEGTGPGRRAYFRSLEGRPRQYEWAAYRFQGRWVYGTSADRLRLVSVEEKSGKNPIIEAFRGELAHPINPEDYAPQDRNTLGIINRWLWYLETDNQEVSSDPVEIEKATRVLLRLQKKFLPEQKRTPYEIAHKLVQEVAGPVLDPYKDDDVLKMTARDLRAYLIEAAAQARA